ncbi:hypothetical protein ACFYTQ_02125 [Nocardia sp. NPDC004068]|uniref:hypothetical protein n=1 Tax=Nocardia sp. NPDC004068 TaxID=3364303 RepID=UPI0036910A9F
MPDSAARISVMAGIWPNFHRVSALIAGGEPDKQVREQCRELGGTLAATLMG